MNYKDFQIDNAVIEELIWKQQEFASKKSTTLNGPLQFGPWIKNSMK